MNAYLNLDDDLADYLTEQAQQERTTLDTVLNPNAAVCCPQIAGM